MQVVYQGKPIHFVYEVWCINVPLGYLKNLTIYKGNSIDVPSEFEQLFGKSLAPLEQMIGTLPEGINNSIYLCF